MESGYFLVFGAVSSWAFASVGYKYSLGSFGTVKRDPIASIGVRILIIVAVMTVLMLFFGDFQGLIQMDSTIRTHYWFLAFLAGLFTVIGDICYFVALRYIDSSRIYPLINCQMLFTYPLAYYFFEEQIPPLMWVAAGLMILGVFFIQDSKTKDKGMENIPPEEQRKKLTIGVLLGILLGFFFAIQYILLHMQELIWVGSLECNYTRLICYTAIIWPYLLFSKTHRPSMATPEGKEQVRAYALMGIIGSLSLGVGDSVYQLGLKEVGASTAITIASTSPILNQIFAIAFLKEKFRPRFLIAVILIVIGNILVIF